MNAETNKTCDEILNNLKNWRNYKKDAELMHALLSKAASFKIEYKVMDDNSESYHFYPALEIMEDEKQNQTFEFVFYMISKNRDTEDFLDKHRDTIEKYIKKIKVSTKQLIEDTEITEEEAKVRKARWRTELKKWIEKNEMFEVFDIPAEDFNLNEKVIMHGHFGMKEAEEKKEEIALSETSFSPDIIIQQVNLDGTSTSFYDMARLSPPWRKREFEFALLNLAM